MNYFRKTAIAAALSFSAAPVLASDFNKLDVNNDQHLTSVEIRNYAEQLPQSPEQLITTFDRNGDRQLSRQEFDTLNTAPMKTAAQDGVNPVSAAEISAADERAMSNSDTRNKPAQNQNYSATEESATRNLQPSASVERDDRSVQRNAMERSVQTSEGQASAQQPERTTITVNQKPATVTVSNTAPKVTVHQPKPEVTITTRDPIVNVEQPEPEISVRQAEPQVNVTAGEPKVDVDQANPQVSIDQAEPEVTTRIAEPQVSIQQSNQPQSNQPQANARGEAASAWASQSVGDLKGKALYDADGQNLGQIVEVVLDPQQQPGLLVEASGESETKYVELQEVRMEQNQLQVSDAEQVKALGEMENLERDQLRPVSDRSRSIRSLLSSAEVSVR